MIRVRVKYEETVTRERTVFVNEDEFVEWFNEGREEAKQIERFSDLTTAEQQEVATFLEDGDEGVWCFAVPGQDPGTDPRIYQVEIL